MWMPNWLTIVYLAIWILHWKFVRRSQIWRILFGDLAEIKCDELLNITVSFKLGVKTRLLSQFDYFLINPSQFLALFLIDEYLFLQFHDLHGFETPAHVFILMQLEWQLLFQIIDLLLEHENSHLMIIHIGSLSISCPQSIMTHPILLEGVLNLRRGLLRLPTPLGLFLQFFHDASSDYRISIAYHFINEFVPGPEVVIFDPESCL